MRSSKLKSPETSGSSSLPFLFVIKICLRLGRSERIPAILFLKPGWVTRATAPLSSSRSFFINNTWRGEEKDKVEDSYKPVIQYKNDKLLLNWVSTNLNTESYTVSINHVEYNIDEGTLSIDNYKFQTDTLRIEITEFFDNQPITKFSGVYLISK